MGGAVPGCEAAFVSEAADLADITEQSCRAGRADPGQFQQAAARGGDQVAEFDVGRLDAFVDQGQFGDEMGGQSAAGLADDIAGTHRRQQGTSLVADRNFVAPPGAVAPGAVGAAG